VDLPLNTKITEPLLTLPARLGWSLDRSFIYGNGGDKPPTDQTLKFIPSLECGLQMAGEYGDIVLDLQSLLESARKPGGYFLLTCECGIADDAGIEELIFVQHLPNDKVVWELDIQGLRSALVKETWLTHKDGFVRLIFDRAQYVTDLRHMVEEVQRENRVLELDAVAGIGDYRFVEELLAFDFDAPIVAEPILPLGSRLDFRLEGEEFCWINGKEFFGWPPRLFPCWEVNQKFKKWIEFVHRGFAIKAAAQPMKTNHFYLLDEGCRAACDAVGCELASLLQKSIDESCNSPQVTVSYSPCLLPAITSIEH